MSGEVVCITALLRAFQQVPHLHSVVAGGSQY
jgi:hypothetical protein